MKMEPILMMLQTTIFLNATFRSRFLALRTDGRGRSRLHIGFVSRAITASLPRTPGTMPIIGDPGNTRQVMVDSHAWLE